MPRYVEQGLPDVCFGYVWLYCANRVEVVCEGKAFGETWLTVETRVRALRGQGIGWVENQIGDATAVIER